MKPGDIIVWVYKTNDEVVDHDEELWSSTMDRWVPIGEKSLLISITNEQYSWLNSNGLFHARVDDPARSSFVSSRPSIVRRARG